ncbi:MAG: type II toxin-antitoxin system VapC family toxin [Methanocellales archaeon]|nr:type II toxin-antitoxin system VapC family toxin [Methanocellales archaeon]MDD3292154.1 type II toxin-antitoxin system VapC family toxin [Methanocellales archaeon]MDD5235391.1 type II toxin-antitoxin system VapC family toxin [Methanocellales archaeon]MDD5485661.1 type II toxin-antitoxin system VapC family toxin [Methanocellales archaeon]
MGDARGDKGHLGIDTNVLVSFLDAGHPDHKDAERLADANAATNPTLIHEAYHTLVYAQKWGRDQAMDVLTDYVDMDTTLFLNQTKGITRTGLSIGREYGLGGRDSLILASFLSNGIGKMVTFDKSLLALDKISMDGRVMHIVLPLDI